jgi:hypothetical protein
VRGYADWQKDKYLQSLLDNTEGNRLSDQDSTAGKVDAELARARDLRDVSDWLVHSFIQADI